MRGGAYRPAVGHPSQRSLRLAMDGGIWGDYDWGNLAGRRGTVPSFKIDILIGSSLEKGQQQEEFVLNESSYSHGYHVNIQIDKNCSDFCSPIASS